MSKDSVLQKFDAKSCLIAICIMGFLLRLFHISYESMWFDEIASFVAVREPTLAEVIETTYVTERTPPLYLVLLHGWTKVFGFSEFSMRVPSAICGFLTIPVMYILAKSLFGNRGALLSSLLLSISPFHIWYSQEARSFTMLVLLTLSSIVFFLRIFLGQTRPARHDYLLYVSVTCLAMYTNYLALFTIIAENTLVFHKWLKKKTLPCRWFSAQVLVALLSIVPLSLFLTKQVFTGYEMGYSRATGSELSATIDQSSTGEPFGAVAVTATKPPSKVGYIVMLIKERLSLSCANSLKLLFIHIPYSFGSGLKYVNRLPYSWSRPLVYLFIFPSVLLFVSLFLYGAWTTRNGSLFSLSLLCLAPLLGVFLIVLLALRPIYPRHTLQSLPLFYIFAARGLYCLPRPKIRSGLFAALIASMVIALSINTFDKKVYKDDWRYITDYVLHDLTSEDFIIFHGEFPDSSFYYYVLLNPDYRMRWETERPATITIRTRDGSLEHFLNNAGNVYDRLLGARKRVWVISYYAQEEERRELRERLGQDLTLSRRDENLGRNLLLELYANPQGVR